MNFFYQSPDNIVECVSEYVFSWNCNIASLLLADFIGDCFAILDFGETKFEKTIITAKEATVFVLHRYSTKGNFTCE